ncbi:DUF4112 domain-containing protein [Altericista sp. CCNU0014]|uniref:DUF4112 domain-containing protein n=1 Tax=Altericista sp. CCNU0014 TaxID=3082949 RepID=UPI0038501680
MSKLTAHPSTPHEVQLQKLTRLRTVSDLWDRAFGIPGTQWRVGLESLLGLLPVGGDVVGLGISIYILWQVVQFNLPKTILLRMVFNIGIDALVGAVPILGDLFDITWKANTKNVNLLESYLREPIKSRGADRRFLWLLFGGMLTAFVLLLIFAITVLALIVQALPN